MNYKVYTDGSCVISSKKGGFGVVMIDETNGVIYEKQASYSNTTNNRMELTAFLDSLTYVLNNCSEEDFVIFYTDSAYISNCFKDGWYKKWLANGFRTSNRVAVKNTDIWKPIISTYRKLKCKCQIEKVASHTGIEWNEYVDGLANQWRNLNNEEDFIIDQN